MTRDEAKEGLYRILGNYYRVCNVHLLKERDVAEEINALNIAIEALERKRGEWIAYQDGKYHCSRCDDVAPKGYRWNYCPNCGADMQTCENE